MYSIQNEGKSGVAERFIWILKIQIYKYMSSISKNLYIDKLDDKVHDYNNTYHRRIKLKPADVKGIAHIDYSKKNNEKDPKFEVGDHIQISKF